MPWKTPRKTKNTNLGVTMANINANALKDYAASFLAILLTFFVSSGADVTSIQAGDLKIWIAAALGAVLPPIIASLDKKNLRYGRKG
jgi:hypothetical protein